MQTNGNGEPKEPIQEPPSERPGPEPGPDEVVQYGENIPRPGPEETVIEAERPGTETPRRLNYRGDGRASQQQHLEDKKPHNPF